MRALLLCAAVLTLAAGVPVPAQSPRATAARAETEWSVPRLPDGRPDLQGVWENNSATPRG
jgi:hypothetical protein